MSNNLNAFLITKLPPYLNLIETEKKSCDLNDKWNKKTRGKIFKKHCLVRALQSTVPSLRPVVIYNKFYRLYQVGRKIGIITYTVIVLMYYLM